MVEHNDDARSDRASSLKSWNAAAGTVRHRVGPARLGSQNNINQTNINQTNIIIVIITIDDSDFPPANATVGERGNAVQCKAR